MRLNLKSFGLMITNGLNEHESMNVCCTLRGAGCGVRVAWCILLFYLFYVLLFLCLSVHVISNFIDLVARCLLTYPVYNFKDPQFTVEIRLF